MFKIFDDQDQVIEKYKGIQPLYNLDDLCEGVTVACYCDEGNLSYWRVDLDNIGLHESLRELRRYIREQEPWNGLNPEIKLLTFKPPT